jgi:hypothetical protein
VTEMGKIKMFDSFFDFCFSIADARDRLKKIKEERLRRSDEVVELWEDVLSKNLRKLGDEGMSVCLSVCLSTAIFPPLLSQFGPCTSRCALLPSTAIAWTSRDNVSNC